VINLIAPQGDIDITSANETYQRTEQMKYKQSGVSVGITNPVISALQTTDQMRQAASQTDDPRMQALAAATTALSVKNAADAVKAGSAGSAGSLADQAGGISLNFSIGSSTAKSSSQTQQTVAKASQVNAGNNVRITATGAGSESDLTVIGSQLKAGQDLSLNAQDQLNLLAAQNTQSLQSSNKSSSASVGVSVGLGSGGAVTPTASFNSSRGSANGQDSSWTETQVDVGNKATLQSGTDTTLKGAQVKGKQVIANVGTSGQGNLNIESLQDTATYKSKQSSSGASVSFGANGIPSGGSVSAGKQKINSDYASVNEQSGIYAGDEGFQVNVNGNTDLKGAVVASTDKAIQDNKNSLTTNTLTTSNIENKAEYDAKGMSMSAGVGVTQQANGGGFKASPTASAGNSHLSDNTSSVTVSGISGGQVNITNNAVQQQTAGKDSTTTLATLNRDVKVNADGKAVDSQGNATAGTLKPIFDQQQIQRELNSQLQITQAFSQQAQQFQIELRKKVDAAKAEQDAVADALKNPNLTDSQRSALIAQGLSAQSSI